MTVQDIISRPENYACPPDIEAIYQINYFDNGPTICAFDFSKFTEDTCLPRAELYDGLIDKGKTAFS